MLNISNCPREIFVQINKIAGSIIELASNTGILDIVNYKDFNSFIKDTIDLVFETISVNFNIEVDADIQNIINYLKKFEPQSFDISSPEKKNLIFTYAFENMTFIKVYALNKLEQEAYDEKRKANANNKSTDSWIITKDYLYEDDIKNKDSVFGKRLPICNSNAVGMCGPNGLSSYPKFNEDTYKFRIYDDDNNLYYEGNCKSQSFAPLEHFGSPNAGASSIAYFNKDTNNWDTL